MTPLVRLAITSDTGLIFMPIEVSATSSPIFQPYSAVNSERGAEKLICVLASSALSTHSLAKGQSEKIIISPLKERFKRLLMKDSLFSDWLPAYHSIATHSHRAPHCHALRLSSRWGWRRSHTHTHTHTHTAYLHT